MDIYKLAVMQNLTVQTNRGLLTPQQLCTLDVNELDALAIKLQEEYEESGGKSFLTKRSVKDKLAKLKFDLVLDITLTKNDELEEARQKAADKSYNQKIINVIARKEDLALENLSLTALKGKLKKV